MPSSDKLAYSVDEVTALASCCRDRIYALIRNGELRAVKNGRRTLVLRADLEAFLDGLPELKSSPPAEGK